MLSRPMSRELVELTETIGGVSIQLFYTVKNMHIFI